MSNVSCEHFESRETPQAPSHLVLQASANDYRSFRDDLQTRRFQANSELVGKGVLANLQVDFTDQSSPGPNLYLKGQISNVPIVSEGIRDFDGLGALGAGIAHGLTSFGKQALNYLETPYSVRDSILQLGPILDTAVDYYSNTPADRVLADAHDAVGAIGDAVNQTLSYPLKPEHRGVVAGALMPMFVMDGTKLPLDGELKQLYSKDIAESELSELGVLRITRRAGKGGEWPVLNERASPDVVQQHKPDGCVAAVGEMLSDGRIKRTDIYDEVKTNPDKLTEQLGSDWKCKFVADEESALEKLILRGKSWSAELHDEFHHRVEMGHMVVVDGIDGAGNLTIRDPQHATRYEMTKQAFIKYWTGRAVWR